MLAIERCDQLSAVEIFQRDQRQLKVRLQDFPSFGAQRYLTDRVHRSAHHEVHFDLHLKLLTAHEQLRLAGILDRRNVGLKTALLHPLSSGFHSLVDLRQRLVARRAVVGEDKIEIN